MTAVFPGDSASQMCTYSWQKLNYADKGCRCKLLKSTGADFTTDTGVSDITEPGQQYDWLLTRCYLTWVWLCFQLLNHDCINDSLETYGLSCQWTSSMHCCVSAPVEYTFWQHVWFQAARHIAKHLLIGSAYFSFSLWDIQSSCTKRVFCKKYLSSGTKIAVPGVVKRLAEKTLEVPYHHLEKDFYCLLNPKITLVRYQIEILL